MTYLLKMICTVGLMLAAACATAPATPDVRQVYVLRHLQAGTGEDPGLTEAGAADAKRLASWVSSRAAPRAIYVSRFRRAQETAAPLAARLAIVPIVYDPADSSALVERLRAETGAVLVVGHSNTVPDIVERLGGTRPEPIRHDQHGDIWRVMLDTGATEKLALGTP